MSYHWKVQTIDNVSAQEQVVNCQLQKQKKNVEEVHSQLEKIHLLRKKQYLSFVGGDQLCRREDIVPIWLWGQGKVARAEWWLTARVQ
jgi:hypothetical protein